MPLADPPILDRLRIELAAPQRDAELLADLVARALVVGVGVGQRVRGDRPSPQLLRIEPACVAGAGVDEHVTEQVEVDRVRRQRAQHVDVVGELLHRCARA